MKDFHDKEAESFQKSALKTGLELEFRTVHVLNVEAETCRSRLNYRNFNHTNVNS